MIYNNSVLQTNTQQHKGVKAFCKQCQDTLGHQSLLIYYIDPDNFRRTLHNLMVKA